MDLRFINFCQVILSLEKFRKIKKIISEISIVTNID